MPSDRLVFNSKLDLSLLIGLLGVTTLCVAVIMQYWDAMSDGLWWAGVILAVIAAVPVWILLTTRYALSESSLFVRCGPFSWVAPIATICAIEREGGGLLSPALSFDRLRIDFENGQRIVISPEPRQAFVQQLEYRRKTLAANG